VGEDYFNETMVPIFGTYCAYCHWSDKVGEDARHGATPGLDYDVYEAAIIWNSDSPDWGTWFRLETRNMPPMGRTPSTAELELIQEWINCNLPLGGGGDDDDDDDSGDDDDTSALSACEGTPASFVEVEPNDAGTDVNVVTAQGGDLVISGTSELCSNDGQTWTGDIDLFTVEYDCGGEVTFTLDWTGADNDLDFRVHAPMLSKEQSVASGINEGLESPESQTVNAGGPLEIAVLCWEGATTDWTFTVDWTTASNGDG
jgi:hypothetical protein